MKKLISVILTALIAFISLNLSAVAASYAPKPTVRAKQYDGYTIVTVAPKSGTTVYYTTNGETPTKSSKKYTKKLKLTSTKTLKLRAYKKGTTSKVYTYRIKVTKADTFEEKINLAKLKPVKSGTELDKYVDKVLDKVVKKNMTTYEKLEACYEWLIDNIEYKVTYEPLYLDYGMRGMKSFDDYLLVEQALYAFRNGYGVCDNFAAAFVVLARAIGVDAYFAGGQCKAAAGGYTGHAWVVIKCGNELRQYDPMLDASRAQKNGLSTSRQYFEREDGTSLYRNRTIYKFYNYERA